MNESISFSTFEKILIASGLLFFANVIYISTGGDFTLLYIAKGVYLIGIVWLLSELITNPA